MAVSARLRAKRRLAAARATPRRLWQDMKWHVVGFFAGAPRPASLERRGGDVAGACSIYTHNT